MYVRTQLALYWGVTDRHLDEGGRIGHALLSLEACTPAPITPAPVTPDLQPGIRTSPNDAFTINTSHTSPGRLTTRHDGSDQGAQQAALPARGEPSSCHELRRRPGCSACNCRHCIHSNAPFKRTQHVPMLAMCMLHALLQTAMLVPPFWYNTQSRPTWASTWENGSCPRCAA
jgi:hypothetical protein